MSQTRKMRRKSGLSKKEQERLEEKKRKHDESWATRISRVVILVVFAAMVVSLAYTVVALSGY